MNKKTISIVVMSILLLGSVGTIVYQQVKINLMRHQYASDISTVAQASAELQKFWETNGEWPEPSHIHDGSFLIYQNKSDKDNDLIYVYRSGLNDREIEFHLSDEGKIFVEYD